jgi:hypothetical protein
MRSDGGDRKLTNCKSTHAALCVVPSYFGERLGGNARRLIGLFDLLGYLLVN